MSFLAAFVIDIHQIMSPVVVVVVVVAPPPPLIAI